MSESADHDEGGPPKVPPADTVWPPAIEHQFLESPVILTKNQRERVRCRWFHVFVALLMVPAGLPECFLTPRPWLSLPQGKLVLCLLLLLGCIGNSWHACQGWQLKALLNRSQSGMSRYQERGTP